MRLIFLALGIFGLWFLIRALRSGRSSWRFGFVYRDRAPALYWGTIVANAAIVAMAFALGLGWHRG